MQTIAYSRSRNLSSLVGDHFVEKKDRHQELFLQKEDDEVWKMIYGIEDLLEFDLINNFTRDRVKVKPRFGSSRREPRVSPSNFFHHQLASTKSPPTSLSSDYPFRNFSSWKRPSPGR